MCVSDDESVFDKADESINPGGGMLVGLTDRAPVDTSDPFVVAKLASTDRLVELPFVCRVAGAAPDGTPMMAAVLETRLVLGCAVGLRALLGTRGLNVRQPRALYSF
jgi:hypothetical protein